MGAAEGLGAKVGRWKGIGATKLLLGVGTLGEGEVGKEGEEGARTSVGSEGVSRIHEGVEAGS
jgi:hypothetical protein